MVGHMQGLMVGLVTPLTVVNCDYHQFLIPGPGELMPGPVPVWARVWLRHWLSTFLSFMTHFEGANGKYFTAGQSLLDEWLFWFIVGGLYSLYYNSSLAIQSYVGSLLVYYVGSVN